jgi:ABC-2 type transport system permease protein
MLTTIARFEFRYLSRNPLVWVTSAVLFAIFFIAMNTKGFELGSEGGHLYNSAWAVLRNYAMISVMSMFVTTSFVAGVILRDDETGYGPIIRSTPITKFEYLFGRFLGAFSMAAVMMLVLPLGMWIGTLMPWADPAMLGPTRIVDHLYGYFLIALPNLFIHAAILFALATMTRSMMATYLGVIGFVAGFFMLQEASMGPQLRNLVAVAEPFAARATRDAVRYWTLGERNVNLPEFTGTLLYNRLAWVGVAMLFLALAYRLYRFADVGMSKRERKRQAALDMPLTRSRFRGTTLSPQAGRGDKITTPVFDPLLPARRGEGGRRPDEGIAPRQLPNPQHTRAARLTLLWTRTKFEAKSVITSPAFGLLMLWGMILTYSALTHTYPEYMPTYPTTLTLIPEIEDALKPVLMVVAAFYASELVWRERDRRVHELIDAAPMPNWAYVIPKILGMGLVFLTMVAVSSLASILFQLSQGFTQLEPGKYLLWYMLPKMFDVMLLAALAMFVQALSPHKAVGWGVMAVFFVHQEFNKGIEHKLLRFGETPKVLLSDLNGAASFWAGAWTVRLYWGALALLLLVVAHLLWRRGTEIRLKPRLALARRRIAGPAGWVAGAALLAFLTTGAYAYYNTNVLNEYRTKISGDQRMADYERRFGKYRDLPQPSLEEMTLDVALYPKERRAVTRGQFLVRNLTGQPIPELYVRLMDKTGMQLTRFDVAGARLTLRDPDHEFRVYRLERPMQPGEHRVLSFETRREVHGFRNAFPETGLVRNGSFLADTALMPILDVTSSGFIQDPEKRRKYGLPGEIKSAKLEDVAARYEQGFGQGWLRKTDITLSTDADQTPIAPGRKVSDVTRDGRRVARFVSTAPTRPRFSVQSARYAEKHRRHGKVDLAVYYHPRHNWNVDRMLDAMAASLDYYEAKFGPYQFDHLRIVEFPAYHGFAQAFAGTIPYSESVGFIADYRKPETLDRVAGMTAHEFAHQWWPQQILYAPMEGSVVLSETLAQYSASQVLKHLRGEDHIRRFLQFQLDRYLGGRAWSQGEEPTLARVTWQDHIAYNKGALAMYLLQKRLGEDAVNRALRNMLSQYRFKGAPFASSVELIAAFRAEAKTPEDQALITDLFERITLYDLEVDNPTAVKRPDGKWDVTVPINAKKMYADAHGKETVTQFNERIEVGLFTAEPGLDAFSASNVLLMERHPIRSGKQVLKFVTSVRPTFAGVDPYNFYVDRDSEDNVGGVS